MQNVITCLWFDGRAEEAVSFYTSLIPNSRIGDVSRYGPGMPMPEGTALTVMFELGGQEYMALNGGPEFSFTEAASLYVRCDTQEEVDHLWSKLTAGGGEESMCGWLKDRWGLSWQIIPNALGEMLGSPDREKAGRAMQAMLQMRKIDIAGLRRAFEG